MKDNIHPKWIIINDIKYDLSYLGEGSSFVVFEGSNKTIVCGEKIETERIIIKEFLPKMYRKDNRIKIKRNENNRISLVDSDVDLQWYKLQSTEENAANKFINLVHSEELCSSIVRTKIRHNSIYETLYFIQPYEPGFVLKNYKTDSLLDIIKIALDLNGILFNLHEHNLLLMDLSLNNFYVSDTRLLLIDTDSIVRKDNILNCFKYNEKYLHPQIKEILENGRTDATDELDFSIDIYESSMLLLDLIDQCKEIEKDIYFKDFKQYLLDCQNGIITNVLQQKNILNRIQNLINIERIKTENHFIYLSNKYAVKIDSPSFNPIINKIFRTYTDFNLNEEQKDIIIKIEDCFKMIIDVNKTSINKEIVFVNGLEKVEKLENTGDSEFIKYYCKYRRQSFLFEANQSYGNFKNNMIEAADTMNFFLDIWFKNKEPNTLEDKILKAWLLNTLGMSYYKIVIKGIELGEEFKIKSLESCKTAYEYLKSISNLNKNVLTLLFGTYSRNYGVTLEIYKDEDFLKQKLNGENFYRTVFELYLNDLNAQIKTKSYLRKNSLTCILSLLNKEINFILEDNNYTELNKKINPVTDDITVKKVQNIISIYEEYFGNLKKYYPDCVEYYMYILLLFKNKALFNGNDSKYLENSIMLSLIKYLSFSNYNKKFYDNIVNQFIKLNICIDVELLEKIHNFNI